MEPFTLAAGCGLTSSAVYAALRWRRTRVYRQLAGIQERLPAWRPTSADRWLAPSRTLPSFTGRLITIPALLPPPELSALLRPALALQHGERSYVPLHKQGTTIAYEHLIHHAPELVAFYLSQELRTLISRIVGTTVVPTPLHDQSSCSLLIYDRPKDRIGWHYDHNFYRGRHFTALLVLMNQDRASDGLSAARLQARIGGIPQDIPTPANTFVLFEGATVLHRVTAQEHDQVRIVLSMTFCTDPTAPMHKAVIRRGKDMAYFGIRALWT